MDGWTDGWIDLATGELSKLILRPEEWRGEIVRKDSDVGCPFGLRCSTKATVRRRREATGVTTETGLVHQEQRNSIGLTVHALSISILGS
jgi:hypothetical protein